MKITKGIIAAAGKGTRFLPAVKAIPKEMLPIVDQPIIQYIVEEFVAAGIKDIIIVTGGSHRIMQEHFGRSPLLVRHLQKTGKSTMLSRIRQLSRMAKISFIRQDGPYGNGTPALAAARAVGRQPFVYAFGDDLVLGKRSFTAGMVAAYQTQPGIYLGVQEVPRSHVHKYGIVNVKKRRNADKGTGEVRGIVEKPSAAQAPSRLAVFGRFILPPEILDVLARKRLGKGGELWLIDGLDALIKQGFPGYYKRAEPGQWLTTGDPVNYLEAMRAYALANPEYRNKVRHIFR